MLTNRDFLGDDFYRFVVKEYEAIRVRRKSRKGKPDEYDRLELDLDKMFEAFYKKYID